MIGITPLCRYLKQQGNEVYCLTKNTGEEILRYNPNVDKLILYNDELKKMFSGLDEVPNRKLGDFFKATAQAYECERIINLCESWEVKLARCPHEPDFKYPLTIAREQCDINYYEQIFRLAEEPAKGIMSYSAFDSSFFTPEMFFSPEETIKMGNDFIDFRKLGKFVILWGLSGSAANKTYPYVPEVIFPILKKYPKVCFLTVGDEVCRVLEFELNPDFYKDKNVNKQKLCERIIRKSAQWSIRESCLATKYANLVIAPDTGILHASGMFNTPKIGLLNHTTIKNITKHFKNDFSLHASEGQHPFFGPVSCSPCFKIHYSKKITCNMDDVKGTQAPICMTHGIPADKVIKRIEEVVNGAPFFQTQDA